MYNQKLCNFLIYSAFHSTSHYFQDHCLLSANGNVIFLHPEAEDPSLPKGGPAPSIAVGRILVQTTAVPPDIHKHACSPTAEAYLS